MDMNDRALRNIVAGLGGPVQGVPREGGFDITAASEIMATLCLAEDPDDLRRRLGRLLVALTRSGEPVTAEDLQAVGAMVVLLKDALAPNLVQTIDGVPAFVHGGPFANIAHGCNSVVATKMAQAHADWTVTEAGFGADLGAEKFLDIKCVSAGLEPSLVVLVATIKALKSHGGIAYGDLESPDADAVGRGLANLAKHVENIQAFGLPVLVALNRFGTDTDDEIDVVRRFAASREVPFAVSDHFARGGEGAEDLARLVVASTPAEPPGFKPMYDRSDAIPTKIEKVAKTLYGARSVVYSKQAEKDLALVEKLGHGELPICMAKTPASLSDDPRLLGRPENFDVTVESMVLAAGAGFVVPLLGSILRMPGLPKVPQAARMDVVDGKVEGLLGA
jgi:formate--tetrahydrofolate ligase